MRASTFALVAGLVFLALGVLGMVPAMLVPPPIDAPPTTFGLLYGYLFGLFPMNALHSLVHLALGAWGIAAWRGVASPGAYARSLAGVMGLLAVLGLIPGANTVFGWMPIHGHDVWLNAGTAALAAWFGWHVEPSARERRSRRMDRRHRMTPVMQERRVGAHDRRFAHARMLAGV